MTILEQVRARAIKVWEEAGLMEQCVEVTAAPLTVEQAIGSPKGTISPSRKARKN
jgi:hypothetical protein